MTDEQYLLLMERLDRIEANTAKPDRTSKKNGKPVETPEQFLARLQSEFPDEPDFDAQYQKCLDHYRVLRQRCTRDTISKWFLRNRAYRKEHGVPDGRGKERGVVM